MTYLTKNKIMKNLQSEELIKEHILWLESLKIPRYVNHRIVLRSSIKEWKKKLELIQ